ncbi:uncharacterized protein J7T54_002297 [Emericellopsis cladophorae]|uniref:Uncharacterized protein n=1 Tax=Emericellopsis cladophorae TaxID=2686198 RepID=A0A9P9Y0Q4_9HYPO|nr:uncharacterized protein J7T54_002297 [Emericellopsis cladophorae]KAI6781404.1 hypothetical protein J7T54_002297 [Emericellopsis cladophorae]
MCEMAMDALKHIIGNVPYWLDRLEELSGQIEKRQLELAAIATSTEPRPPGPRSLRNKGSTESLKPANDGPSMIPDTEAASPAPRRPMSGGPQGVTQPPPEGPADTAAAGPPGGRLGDGATAKKRQRSASTFAVDDAPHVFRTRKMIIVYYDSYVQRFFDDLVRFISSSRNMMRKAKMAARVAQIKKMAEMDMSSTDGRDDDGESLPSLRYLSSRRMRPGRAGPGSLGGEEQPDAYSHLDKGLEFIQCTCEHGAHQFLRDADCKDEIAKIGMKLRDVLDMAQKEMDRVLAEEPELARETSEVDRTKSCRPISVRRELSAQHKEGLVTSENASSKLDAATSARSQSSFIQPATKPLATIELEPDEGIDVELEMPKLQYRSTRHLRAPRVHYVSNCT